MDTNMRPPQGVFVEFFGHQACTASGLARVRLKTGAAVLPGSCVERQKKVVLRFGRSLALRRAAMQSRCAGSTQMCAAATEDWIRRYPDQWLWIHRGGRRGPAGEPALY